MAMENISSMFSNAKETATSAATRLSEAVAGDDMTVVMSNTRNSFVEVTSTVNSVGNDLTNWAGEKVSEAGSAATERTIKLVQAKFGGEEIWEMLNSLAACTNRASEELNLKSAKFGIPFALPLVILQHSSCPPPFGCNVPLEDLDLVREACYWLHFAIGAYGAAEPTELDAKSSVKQGIDDSAASHRKQEEQKEPGGPEAETTEVCLGIGKSTATAVVEALKNVQVTDASLPEKGINTPGYFVAIDRTAKAVVLGIRGTSTLSDAVTDAVGESTKIKEVPEELQAHQAMLTSAKRVLESTRSMLENALSQNSGFTLIVTGHSLGAGTATLCSILLNADPVKCQSRLRCFAFAPPPVVSSLTANAVKDVEIHSFVNRADVVPCASLANIFSLGEQCMAVDGLDLDLATRSMLISGSHWDDKDKQAILEQAKTRIMKVISESQEERKQKHHEKFPALFIAGDVYWIGSDDQHLAVQDSEKSEDALAQDSDKLVKVVSIPKAKESDPRVRKVDAKSFQALHLRGVAEVHSACKDHLGENYRKGLEGYRDFLEEKLPKYAQCGFCACQ